MVTRCGSIGIFGRISVIVVIALSLLLLLASLAMAVEETTTTTAETAPASAATPAATIAANPPSGPAPLTVTFSVSSTVNFTSYSWDFQDDGTIDSREATPSFTYAKEGIYTARVSVTTSVTTEQDQAVNATTTITVKKSAPPLTLSLTARPLAGVAPLAVQFLAVAANGKEPLTYTWDYTADGTIDSTEQNPATTFDDPGEYNVTLTVTDAAGNTAQKMVPITVTAFDSLLELSSYFPDEVTKGENKITLIVKNGGTRLLTEVAARVVGKGIQHLSSTTIPSLKAGEEDSITLTVNVLKTGAKDVTIKVLDKTFPINLTLVKEIEYNKEELERQFNLLKEKLQEQEQIFADKKSQNYLVGEIFESSIKPAKKQAQDVQEQLLTGKLAEAKVGLDLLNSMITDLTINLEQAQKLKVTKLQWLKDNAGMIAAIILAFGTIGGFLAAWAKKAKTGAEKLTETVKQKLEARKNSGAHSEKAGEHHAAEKTGEHHPEQHEQHREPKEEPQPAEAVKEEHKKEAKVKKKGRKKKKEGKAEESPSVSV